MIKYIIKHVKKTVQKGTIHIFFLIMMMMMELIITRTRKAPPPKTRNMLGKRAVFWATFKLPSAATKLIDANIQAKMPGLKSVPSKKNKTPIRINKIETGPM